MAPALQESRSRLAPLGRLLADGGTTRLWDRETQTLPSGLRKRRQAYRRFAAEHIRPRAAEADLDPAGYDPRPLLALAGRLGYQSELLPPPLGALDPRALLHAGPLLSVVLRAEEFTAACGGIGLSLLAHDLGTAPLLLSGHLPTWGRWLLPTALDNRRGRPRLAAFAITEPGAGSDVEDTDGARTARYTTTARRAEGGYVLDGQKAFISGGAHADLVCVFAVLARDDGTPARVDTDWTCFVVERGRAGFRTGRQEHKLGQRAADATELFFDDVFVPHANLVGHERSGWALNRNVLTYSRLPVAAIALGIARGAVEAATEFAQTTTLAGRPLVEHQEVQLRLADMWLGLMAMRGMIWQGARHRVPSQTVTSAAKVFCSDTAYELCTQAMDLLADQGYHSSRTVEKALRDARLTQIYEGTNQINRLAVVESITDAVTHGRDA
jgi:alkylation response protein AidB-like acyl-CoA dehydrogenase